MSTLIDKSKEKELREKYFKSCGIGMKFSWKIGIMKVLVKESKSGYPKYIVSSKIKKWHPLAWVLFIVLVIIGFVIVIFEEVISIPESWSEFSKSNWSGFK
ncbi:MAG: hypothetical protein IPP05_22160 [Cytophagaceae bacterium]|nr:hypothetical protein [Cytophagaceae bacterium]